MSTRNLLWVVEYRNILAQPQSWEVLFTADKTFGFVQNIAVAYPLKTQVEIALSQLQKNAPHNIQYRAVQFNRSTRQRILYRVKGQSYSRLQHIARELGAKPKR